MEQVGGLKEAKLLTPTEGWARSDKQLMFTTDQGVTWKDITPKAGGQDLTIADLLFSTPSQGWVLRQKPTLDGHAWNLILSSTENQGGTWQDLGVTGIPIHDLELYGGNAKISFVGHQNGWLELQVATSSNFSSSWLFETKDGGGSWQELPRPPIFGDIALQTDGTGYLTGGVADNEFYRTVDGGRTWIKPKFPDATNPDPVATKLSIPHVEGANVTLTRTVKVGSHITVQTMRSVDGGITWTVAANSPELPAHQTGVASLTGGSAMHAFQTVNGMLAIGGERSNHTAMLPSAWSGSKTVVLGISFPSSQEGWVLLGKTQCGKVGCLNGNYLLRTKDGGATVEETPIPFTLTPDASLPVPSSLPRAISADRAQLEAASPAPFVALPSYEILEFGQPGIDAVSAPDLDLMDAWAPTYSHSGAIGIYIGGANRYDKIQANLSGSWIREVNCYGWAQIPIWVGPQSPGPIACPTCSLFTTDLAGARAQGTVEARKAVAAMQSLGLPSGIIYYDMENYGTPYTGADNAFVEGWVTQLHSLGYDAGMYGSPYNAADWLVQDPPDDVWLSRDNGNSTSVYGQYPLPDGYWVYDQRLNQYKLNVHESYLGYKLTVDYNLIAATIESDHWNYGECICSDPCNTSCSNYDPTDPSCGNNLPGPCDACQNLESLPNYCCSLCGECNVY